MTFQFCVKYTIARPWGESYGINKKYIRAHNLKEAEQKFRAQNPDVVIKSVR